MTSSDPDEKVKAKVTGREIFDLLRRKDYTLDQCRTVASEIAQACLDERE